MSNKRGKDDAGKKYRTIKPSIFRLVRVNVLRPCYYACRKIAPKPAEWIKNNLLDLWYSSKIWVRQQMQKEIVIKGSISYENKLLVDVTTITLTDANTGIQRVTREVSRELVKCGAILVRDWHGKLVTSRKFHATLFDEGYDGNEYEIKVKNNNLFLLDSSWNCTKDFSKIITKIKKEGGRTIGLVHDIIPVLYPDLIASNEMKDIFFSWHKMLLELCDVIICDSHTTANNIKWLQESEKIRNNNDICVYGAFLGSDFDGETKNSEKKIRNQIKNFVDEEGDYKVFLMVGTIEPRKGHRVALNAIKELVNRREKVKLLIIGHDGWNSDDFIYELYNKTNYGKNFLWINDASDDELIWCYKHSAALIAASKDEGYGLPLVEAGYYGLPILCSDIPIFREVAENHVTYFKEGDSSSLFHEIKKWINEDQHPNSSNIQRHTWKETSEYIMKIMAGQVRQDYTICKVNSKQQLK